MITPNRNKTNFDKLKNKNNFNPIDTDLMKLRIKENLQLWEMKIDKFHNIEYSKKIAQLIKANQPTRLILSKRDPASNEKIAYTIAKHFVNAGISPSEIVIVSLEDCYLSARGFGEQGQIKSKIFNPKNKVILIENMREIRSTDVKDNVNTFWLEFFAFCQKQKDLNVLLSFDKTITTPNWFTFEETNEEDKSKYLSSMNFKYV